MRPFLKGPLVVAGYISKVAGSCPLDLFGNNPPQMRSKKDLNIGVSPGFGGLIQGQIYNPDIGDEILPSSVGDCFIHHYLP